MGPGAGCGRRGAGAAAAVRRARQVPQPPRQLHRLQRARGIWSCAGRSRGPCRPARRRQRRQHGRRGRSAACARARRRHRRDAGSGFRPWLCVRRSHGAAARRRHSGRHGGCPRARAPAPARRQAVSVRVRSDVGVRRGVHDASRDSRTCSPSGSSAVPITIWPARRSGRKSARSRCEGSRRRAMPLRSSCSTSRPTRWACTSPTWR